MKNKFEIKGNIVVIFLKKKNGQIIETTIDLCDLPRAQEFPMTWYSHWREDSQTYYVFGNTPIVNKKRTIIALHRWLTNAPGGIEVDHFNNNGLDNRRSTNLRLVTCAQNCQNKKFSPRNKSGYKGVHWCNLRKKWVAQIRVNNKTTLLGRFDDIFMASQVYNEARKRLMPFSKEAILSMRG